MNAIILAAGEIENTWNVYNNSPKALFIYKGEKLIERLINQLMEAGISRISIVVGFQKEKFLYLISKYNINLIINESFIGKGSLLSLISAKNELKNTIVCDSDCFFEKNPFLNYKDWTSSFHTATIKKNAEHKLSVDGISLRQVWRDKSKSNVFLSGFAYFDSESSNYFRRTLKKNVSLFELEHLYWEEYLSYINLGEKFLIKILRDDDILELNSQRDFFYSTEEFIDTTYPTAILNISKYFGVDRSHIFNIRPIKAGLTNSSIIFRIKEEDYVYREPGASSLIFINGRRAEQYSQKLAFKLGIDKTFIYMDPEQGWKISKFKPNSRPLDFSNLMEAAEAFELLNKLHSISGNAFFQRDIFTDSMRLFAIAEKSRPYIANLFSNIISKIQIISRMIQLDDYPKCICHNDVYGINFLCDGRTIDLIDWEYSGTNEAVNDFACIVSRENLTEDQISRLISLYLKGKRGNASYRHTIASIALCSWYWFCWSLCKDALKEDYGFFYLPTYKNAIIFSEQALKLYRSGNNISYAKSTI